MSTTTTTPAPARQEPAPNTLAGTGTLTRFILRRDRVRIPVWLGALSLGTMATANSFSQLYPTAADRATIAQTMNSPAALAMTGPKRYLAGYDLGAMLGHQMIGFTGILVALMSVLLVTRHTRTEEEAGRAELVRAGVVGRHAQLAATLTVVVGVNLALALLLTGFLSALGLSGIGAGGALLYGAAHAGIGIVFAGVAAVTVQISQHSRAASGMAFAVIALAYALRAAGDVGSGAASWLSPIGWAQRTLVFVDNRAWPLLLCVGLAAALITIAAELSTRRDVGIGLRSPRAGAAGASPWLLRPVGFALRLHRGLLLGFGIGLLLLGTMYGSILDQVESMISDIEVAQRMVAGLGGTSVAESFLSAIMLFTAPIATIYPVLAVNRARSEETAGRAEPMLATGLSRRRWVTSHAIVALVGGTLVQLAAGLGLGLAGAAALGEGGTVGTGIGAALAYLPAIWFTTGVAVALFGWLPRATPAAWIVVVYAFVVGYLGNLLQFPQWVRELSPYEHIPHMPAADFALTPLLILTALAAALIAVGVLGFRRRDLEAA